MFLLEFSIIHSNMCFFLNCFFKLFFCQLFSFRIQEIIQHQNYSEKSKQNDIALIRLTNQIVFTPDIRPACLETDLKDLNPEIRLNITRWSSQTSVEGKFSSIWRKEFFIRIFESIFFFARRSSSARSASCDGTAVWMQPNILEFQCWRKSSGVKEWFERESILCARSRWKKRWHLE